MVVYRKFSKLLESAIARYGNRPIFAAQLMEELLAMARAYREAQRKGESLGLNREESAFYSALADNEEAVRQLGDATLKLIATELLRQIRANATVDWEKRDSVRAQLRLMVKRILRKHRYPPEGQDDAVKLVIEQAEEMSRDWAQDGVRRQDVPRLQDD